MLLCDAVTSGVDSCAVQNFRKAAKSRDSHGLFDAHLASFESTRALLLRTQKQVQTCQIKHPTVKTEDMDPGAT